MRPAPERPRRVGGWVYGVAAVVALWLVLVVLGKEVEGSNDLPALVGLLVVAWRAALGLVARVGEGLGLPQKVHTVVGVLGLLAGLDLWFVGLYAGGHATCIVFSAFFLLLGLSSAYRAVWPRVTEL